MRFSVIINNYNYGRFISAAIDSVLAQTHRDFELIVIDDGSSDDSRVIIARYSDPRLRSIFQANGGQGAAFQAGFAAATGDAIALLDSDDEWMPEKLSRCAAVLEARPQVSLLQHGWDIIDANGRPLGTHPSRAEGRYDARSDYRRLRFDLPFGPTSCIAGPRRFFGKLFFRADEWRIAADTPVVAGLSVLGDCEFIPDRLMRYRLHGRNGFEGQQNQSRLIELRRRFYDSVNVHNALLNQRERFQFERSSVFQADIVTRSPPWTLHGLLARARLQLAKLKGV